jgi:hypothetical protein
VLFYAWCVRASRCIQQLVLPALQHHTPRQLFHGQQHGPGCAPLHDPKDQKRYSTKVRLNSIVENFSIPTFKQAQTASGHTLVPRGPSPSLLFLPSYSPTPRRPHRYLRCKRTPTSAPTTLPSGGLAGRQAMSSTGRMASSRI